MRSRNVPGASARCRALGSTRVSRAGDDVLAIANFSCERNPKSDAKCLESSFRRGAETSTREACATNYRHATVRVAYAPSQGHPPSLRYRVAVRKHSYNLGSVAAARSTGLRHAPLQKARKQPRLLALKKSLEAPAPALLTVTVDVRRRS